MLNKFGNNVDIRHIGALSALIGTHLHLGGPNSPYIVPYGIHAGKMFIPTGYGYDVPYYPGYGYQYPYYYY